MGFTVWLCALCLQASLLLHALDCSAAAAAAPRVSRKTADAQVRDAVVTVGRAKVFIRRAAVITFAVVTLSGASPSPVKHCFHARERRARGEAPSPLVKVLGVFFVCVMAFFGKVRRKKRFFVLASVFD